jgi:hypothetical protein
VANVYQTNIQIGGAVSPSLYKAIGLSQSQMALLTKNINSFNALAKKSQSALNGLPPSLQKANVQVNKLNAGFQRMGDLVKGVAIGDLIASGVRSAVRMIDVAIGKLEEFTSKALETSAKFEKSSWALGNVLGSRVLGNQLAGQLSQLGKTQFGGVELTDIAKQLSAAGVPTQNLLGTTRELGNIVGGAGGGKEELNTLTTSYIRALNRGYVDPRSLQALGRSGIPLEETLMKLYGSGDLVERDSKGNPKKIFHGNTDAEKRAKIQEMLSKRMITTAMFQQALADMVGKTGVFANGMSEHAKTFSGAVEEMQNQTEVLMREFGDLERDALQPLVVWFNQSGVWQYAHEWLTQAREWTDGVVSYFKVADIGSKLGPVFARIQSVWTSFNSWLDGNFKEFHNPATGNIEKALTPGAAEKLQQVIDKINEMTVKISDMTAKLGPVVTTFSNIVNMLNKIDEVLYGKIVPFLWDHMIGAFVDLSHKLHQMFDWIPDLSGSSGAGPSDAIASLYSSGSGPTGYGGRGSGYMNSFNSHRLSDSDNELYYEHLDTEGHSSQYGPHNNKLGYGYGIGIGAVKQKQTGAYYGKWVKVRLPNGSTIIRQVNETSSRDHGIELETPHTDESSYGNGKATIEGVYDTKPSAETHVHIHVNSIDSQDAGRFISENAHDIAKHVHRHLKDQLERSAIV